MSDISFILPALNEGRSIGEVIDRIPSVELRRRGYAVDVWVLDGMSTDQTASVARAKGAKVYLQRGRGKGRAVAQSFEFLKSDYVVMLDADNTYDPRDMLPMMALLEDGHDVVMGSRLRGKIEEGAMSGKHRLGNHLLSAAATVLFGRRVSDLCTGFWGFKGRVLRQLEIDAKGFELEAQMFSRCAKLGLTIGEMPIGYGRRGQDETKLQGLSCGLRILRTLVAERLARRWPDRGCRAHTAPRRAVQLAPAATIMKFLPVMK